MRRRRPQYLPLSVNSIKFTQTESGGAAIAASSVVLTVGSSACVNSSGGQTCTATLTAALGQDQWTVNSYASSNGSGAPLSQATLVQTVVAGAANVSNLTLNPVLTAIAFVPASASCNAASACTQAVTIKALDENGATIVGPGSFVNASGTATPITLSASATLTPQTLGGTTAPTTIAMASDATLAQVVYDGTSTNGTKTMSANANGVTTAIYTLTLASGSLSAPASVSVGNLNPASTSIAVSENGYGGTFSQTNNCAGIATIGSASGSGPSATFSVTQLGGGTCTVLIADDHGGSQSVSILSTTFSVNVSRAWGSRTEEHRASATFAAADFGGSARRRLLQDTSRAEALLAHASVT